MSKNLLPLLVCLLLWLACLPAAAQPIAQDQAAAVIFAYHRIGEDQYPETNIRREQFAAHVQELASGDYNVMALSDIIRAFRDKDKLPERTIALTFDGGHKSVLQNAIPLLEEHELPYTLFVPTNHIDRNSADYMSWADLKKLGKRATIGLHPASYIRLYDKPETEITRQVNNARIRFRDELGKEPEFFAYPFGEYGQIYSDIIEKQGFTAAFGQQSGAIYAEANMLSLPRFPMTESYGGLDRFRLTANALPLPVTAIEPKDTLLKTAKPSIGFTVDKALHSKLESISCFISGQDKPDMKIIGENRIELRLKNAFETEKARINCTLPLPTGENFEDPRWRWFGMQLIVPKDTHQSWNTDHTAQKDG